MKRPLILNVDDREISRYLRSQSLIEGGFTLIDACTGSEALQSAFRYRPDLVLLDVNLPDANGTDICRILKSDPRTASAMVLQISASAVGIADAIRGLDGGADGYLIEPVEPELLLAHVRSLLRLRASEMALHRSEQRLHFALQGAQMATWEWNVATNEVVWGGFHHELLGLDGNRYEGTFAEVLNAVHLEDRASFEAKLRNTLEKETNYHSEFRILRGGLDVRWMQALGKVVRDASGEPLQMIGVVSDITSRRRAEQELRANQERLALALETNQLSTWDWDLLHDKVVWAGRHCQLLGIAEQDFDGTYEGFLSHIHPDDRELVRAEMARVMGAKQEHYVQEYRTVWPDGSVHWLESRARFFYDGEGRPVRQLGIVQDLTARKEAEHAIRESEERLTLSYSAAGIGLWDWNLLSGERVFNDEFVKLYGSPPVPAPLSYEEWLGRAHPEDRERARKAFQLFFESGSYYDDEFRVIWPNGIVKWLESKGRALRDAHGTPTRLIGVLYDITGRKRAEMALAQANAEVQQFAFAAGHDLQAPIRTARIYADMLRRELGSNLEAPVAKRLETIETNLNRMQALVTNLLHYAHASQLPAESPAATPLDEALRVALANLQGEIDETGAAIVVCPLPTVPAWGDQLTRVFQNLISNALKYRRPELRPLIEITAEREDGPWVIGVRDNGCGFPPEYAERIFNVFERLARAGCLRQWLRACHLPDNY